MMAGLTLRGSVITTGSWITEIRMGARNRPDSP
jgi:hypothetical protein